MVTRWKIAIDARSAHRPGSGVPSYSLGLIKALCQYRNSYDFVFVIEEDAPIEHITFPDNSEFYVTRVRKNSRFSRDLWENSVLPRTLTKMGVHLYHGLDYSIPLIKTSFLKVSTMHDATVFTDQDERHWLSKLRVRIIHKAVVRMADAIVTDSMFSKTEIMHYSPVNHEKIEVVWCGVDDNFYQPLLPSVEADVRLKLVGCDYYILYYGGFRKNKNIEGLLRAYALIARKINAKLVLVGHVGDYADGLNNLIRKFCIEDQVVLFGYASEDELKYLLRECQLFVFPSLMEGFGLPVAEAMVCGAPVVCSRAASLPEIAGDSVYYFDPNDPQDIADKILDVLNNRYLRHQLIERGKKRASLFKWERSAYMITSLYATLLERQ